MEIKYRSEYLFEYEALEATVITEAQRLQTEAILEAVIGYAQRKAKPTKKAKRSSENTKYYLTNSYKEQV